MTSQFQAAVSGDPATQIAPIAYEEEPAPARPDPVEYEDPPLEHEPLPRRPRRRLVTPATLVLLAVALTASGFVAGVQVQKHQGGDGFAGRPTPGMLRSGGAMGGEPSGPVATPSGTGTSSSTRTGSSRTGADDRRVDQLFGGD